MLQVKYASKKIGNMAPDELNKWAHVLLLKINVITGWIISENDTLQNILSDQFRKTLVEKYSELNPDEIEFAFRNNGTGIEDWGKEMNLNLIDKVLVGYLHDRYKLSSAEEQIATAKDLGEFDLKKCVNWRKQVEENYQYFIHQNKFYSIHPFEYDQLETDGFIEPGAYKYRLSMYQKRLLMSDREMAVLAKERTVLQLFRAARRMKRVTIYERV